MREVITEAKNKIVEQLNKLFYTERNVNLVLVNDNYVFEGIVRQGLRDVLNYSDAKARDLMMTAHVYGSAIVWTGVKQVAEEHALRLRTQYGLTTEVVES
jgi:ATP-dependent Clp protease adapter protein ClpS